MTTSSSKSLDERSPQIALTSTPNDDNTSKKQTMMLMLTTAEESIEKGYQPVYVELQKKKYSQSGKNVERANCDGYELWRRDAVIYTGKNKLKRKKKLSASLTSVSDSVNQEKRTRIEGIQLNCRGKLQLNGAAITSRRVTAVHTATLTNKVAFPKGNRTGTGTGTGGSTGGATATARVIRRLDDNVQTIQKLNAFTDRLRAEINELKSSLLTERGAVRTLRAKNESELRRWKCEVKRLQHALQLTEKAKKQQKKTPVDVSLYGNTKVNGKSISSSSLAASNLVNYEIQKLINEINVLKVANRNFGENKSINGEADRRKAADVRTLRDSYEIRLTQVQKSAKNEIVRLLEEIKSKERSIGLLKKDLRILQNSRIHNSQSGCKRSASMMTKNEQTNKTTTINKPKKPLKKSSSSTSASSSAATVTAATTEAKMAMEESTVGQCKDTNPKKLAHITDESGSELGEDLLPT